MSPSSSSLDLIISADSHHENTVNLLSDETILERLKDLRLDAPSIDEDIKSCIETGHILGRPLGDFVTDLLALSVERKDSSYENISITLVNKLIHELKKYYKNEFGPKPTLTNPAIIAQISLEKINQQGLSGATFLIIIVRSLYAIDFPISKYLERVVQYLLENGADSNVQDCNGKTALHEAVSSLNVNVCKSIVESGAALDMTDLTGSTPFHYIYSDRTHDGKKPKLQRIMIHNSNKSPKNEVSAYVDICRLFRDRGFNVNVKNLKGRTLLHQSIAGRYALCEFLLRNGADIDDPDVDGQTPLHIACIADSEISISLLKRFKASETKDRFGNTPFFYVCASRESFESSNRSASRRIFMGNLSDLGPNNGFELSLAGWSPLHIAAYFGNVKTARWLILRMKNEEEVANLINCAISTSGKTALMIACEKGFLEFCLVLVLQPSLKRNMRDTLVGTALDWAFEFEQVEIATILFEKGFADGLKDENKAQLMQRALQAKYTEQRRLLDLLRNTWTQWGNVLKIAQIREYADVVEYLQEAQIIYSLDMSEEAMCLIL